MPSRSQVDPELLDATASRVAAGRDDVLGAAGALLDRLADTGDRATQARLDALLDQAVDTLRGLGEELTGTVRGLRTAAQRYAETERRVALGLPDGGVRPPGEQ